MFGIKFQKNVKMWWQKGKCSSPSTLKLENITTTGHCVFLMLVEFQSWGIKQFFWSAGFRIATARCRRRG
jgi:hypothetical protein